MLLIAIPFLSIRLGSSDQGNDPTSTTTRQAYDLLAKGFGPGFNGPLQLVAKVPDQAAEQQFARIVQAAKTTGGRGGGHPRTRDRRGGRRAARGNGERRAARVAQDSSTTDLVNRLRDHTIPIRPVAAS